MRKKYYIFVLTFLFMLCGQMSYAGDRYGGELENVVIVVYGHCHPENPDYDPCECDGIDCPDSGDCNDPSSNSYPCEYVDDGNCTDTRSSAYPCDSNDPCDQDSIAYDPCECDPSSCEEQTPPEDPQDPPCAITSCPAGYVLDTENCECKYERICPIGFIKDNNCNCIKKVDEDCKKFKKSTFVPNDPTYRNKGETITLNGPFYFSTLDGVPSQLYSKDSNNNVYLDATLNKNYTILEHGNYYEIKSLSYTLHENSKSFTGGTLGGFTGGDCPDDNTPQPPVNFYGYSSGPDDNSTNDDSFYENSGAFAPPPKDDTGKAKGASKEDAKKLQDDIFRVLDKSPKFTKFKTLITRGPKNNQAYFSKIPQDKLNEALNDLDDGDQKTFATIVANTINSDKEIIIQYFDNDFLIATSTGIEIGMNDFYNIYSKTMHPKMLNILLNSPNGFTFNELMFRHGSGLTIKNTNKGTIKSIIYTKGRDFNSVISLHEFFGHGRPLSIESPVNIHDSGDAVRFENLVWRLLGEPNRQNDGSKHANKDNKPLTDPYILPTFR